jgi:hypothetical protein
MAVKSKAQTVVERAARRADLGIQLTAHTCGSSSCPTPGERIALRDVYPVVSITPYRHTLIFHRSCAPHVAGPR